MAWTVIAIAIVAAVLRCWGLTFGFPHVLAHPDEVRVVHTGVRFLSGDLNPGFFNYPSLFMYALGLLDLGYCGLGIVTGRFASLAACAASWPSAWEPFFLIARALSASAGIATVWMLWRVARRLFDEATGLAAAALLAVSFLHVRDSHFGVTDVAMTGLVLVAVLLLVRAHDKPSVARFSLAGLVAGLATGTKYSAALLAVVAIAEAAAVWSTDFGRQRDRQNSLVGVGVLVRLAMFGAAMIAGFFISTPYALLDPIRFWTDAAGEADHLRLGHGMVLDIGWRHHFAVTLWHGATWPVLIVGVAGAVAMIAMHPSRAALLLAFPLAYYVVAGRGYTVFARYMVPVIPFLCICAGYAAVGAARRLARIAPVPLPVAATVAVMLLGCASLVKSVQLDRLLARTDSRVLASTWLLEHAPPGASIYLSGSGAGRAELAPHGRGRGYVTANFDAERGVFRAERADLPDGPDVIVVQESPLVQYSAVPEQIEPWLAHYELRHRIVAFDEREDRVYDQQDAFFLPLANFRRMSRPGPNVVIYVRRGRL